MDRDAAVQELRTAAISRLVGHEVGSDKLILLGLDALLAGIDTPSLPLLAGLTRGQEPEAGELFDRVLEELQLVPVDLPDERTARKWALVRWWARLIVDGVLDVHTGGELIYWHGRELLDSSAPSAFKHLYASVVNYDDVTSSWAVWDTDYLTRCHDAITDVIRDATALLTQPDEQDSSWR